MKVLPFQKRPLVVSHPKKEAKLIPLPVKRRSWRPSLVEGVIKACERADARESRTGREISDGEILEDIERRRNPPGNDEEPDPAA